MAEKIRILLFWVRAFWIISRQTVKGNTWHMVYVDFHYGDDENGRPKRKQLIARRETGGLRILWQDFGAAMGRYEGENG